MIIASLHASAATNLTDRSRRDVIVRKYAYNLFGFPGRFLDVPGSRLLPKINTTYVHFFNRAVFSLSSPGSLALYACNENACLKYTSDM
jgi:hypothetical protein